MSVDLFNDVSWPTCLAPAPVRSKTKIVVRVDAVVLVIVVVVVIVVDDVVLAPTHGPYVGA